MLGHLPAEVENGKGRMGSQAGTLQRGRREFWGGKISPLLGEKRNWEKKGKGERGKKMK